MQVERLMSENTLSVRPEASAADCAELMAHRGVGAVLVTEAGGRLLGIVTDRDIVVRCVAPGYDPSVRRASEIMTRNPQTVSPGADIREAAAVMAGGKVRRLPVVENGTPVGVISLGDLSASRLCDAEAGLAMSRICRRDASF